MFGSDTQEVSGQWWLNQSTTLSFLNIVQSLQNWIKIGDMIILLSNP